MKDLPYNLIKEYPTSDWEIDIIKQRIIHKNDIVFKKLSKYGLKYAITEDGLFFPTNLHIIGLGAYSIVYAIGDENNYEYVLKITNNATEVNWTKTVKSLQSVKKEYENNYVKIYDYFKSNIKSLDISGSYDDKINCTFIVIEKLYVLTKEEEKIINDFDDKMYQDIKCELFSEYIEIDEISEYIEELELSDKPLDKSLKLMINSYLKLAEDVDKFGWFDFHFHNLMKTNNGNYKFIDLQSY